MNQSFGVGSVLGTGFRVYGRNIIAFTLITAVVYVPIILWTLSLVSGTEMSLSSMTRYVGGVGILSLLLNSFVSATLTYGVVKELQGQRASIGACLATGFSRMLPALGVGVLTALAIVGGCVLLIVPGIIAACALYVAMPASVIEKPGVVGALKRSAELTKGYRGAIFGLLLVMGVGNYALGRVEQAVFPLDSMAHIKTYLFINCGTSIIVGALSSVIAAVAYFQLRADKDGTTAHDLAKVFE
jgi:uncharacterized membrane protein